MNNNNTLVCFEEGSQWLRADFHLHTKADKEFSYQDNDNEFVRRYVEALKQAGIGVGVITNHNKFNDGEFKALRKRARKESILLLPGVELSVNDGSNGVHVLIVFSESWLDNGNDYVSPFITTMFPGKSPEEYENENARSDKNILQVVEELEKTGREYFLVFAHIEQKSGLWKEMGGGKMGDFASPRYESVRRRTLAFQKVRTRDEKDKVKQWLKGWHPADVEGCDAKSLDEIGSGRCSYLKIGALTFDAVRYALADHEYRVRHEPPRIQHSHIRAVRFEGGLLDGRRLAFSSALNCLIGIRGSGKSSILEAIRYALNLPFGQKAQDTRYKESLIPHLLGSGGKVIVEAVDRHGQAYEIHRILNELPDVYVDGQLQPGLAIDSTIIHKPLYFGQKDLSATGEGFETDLVEKLVARQLTDVRRRIEEQKRRVLHKIETLRDLSDAEEKRKEYEDRLKDAEYKLKIFRKHGVEDKLKEKVAFNRDLKRCEQIQSLVDEWLSALENLLGQYEDDLRNAVRYQRDVNAEFFRGYFEAYQPVIAGLDAIKKVMEETTAANQELKASYQSLVKKQEALKESFAQIERELAESMQQSGHASVRPDEFVKQSKERDRYKQLIEAAQKQEEKEKRAHDDLLKALAALNDLWWEEFRIVQKELEQINQGQSALELEAEFKGDKGSMRDYLKQVFRGSKLRETFFEQLCQQYADFGAMYRELDKIASEASSGEKFREYFLKHLKDLLTWQVPNRFVVKYRGKPLQEHSLGQRASAMMLFILSRKENNLIIIDQPEDDLDNQTIYEDVIKLIRKIKENVQFIFATHNANFPVLGDAEQVIACTYHSDHIDTQTGSIDCPDIQQSVVNIMEGGEEAFNRRKAIYQLWKP
ncbi:TrlF family AAA-like ATPase [Thiolapillus sp.]|uniref:TrlF family AAA-like ATPase n=1 Tax=Thiolapillus sp. TaxID=2017437 RepID=UPI003AF5A133